MSQYDPGMAIFDLLGVFSLVMGIRQVYRDLAPRKWAIAEGKIIASTLEEHFVNPGSNEIFPTIKYEYSYDGQTFTSSQWRVSNYSSGQSLAAKQALSRYPSGEVVKVFVNRKKPASAVLEYGLTPLGVILVGVGLFILSPNILFLLKHS